ncbi:MAG TPA: LacI family DNA-binding transcriptional regulator [Alphaproteobacteria bacterium]|nr:LacI family DNA-binding transcriptional regulator [Alphaproteobacteria bacterium]
MSKKSPAAIERKVTIHDIAREAGVSVATVSRTFSHPDRVREATREQILSICEKHHFVADAMARSLARRRSGFLAVIIPSLYNSIYAASTQAIQNAAEAAGYTVLIGVSEFSKAREAQLIRQFVERRVEGLILTGADRDRDAQQLILRNQVPSVITWLIPPRSALPWVSFDNYAAAAAVVDHLAGLGHRRIALVCGRTDVNDRALARRRGFEARMRALHLSFGPADIRECEFDFTEGRKAMRGFLDRGDPPTAVFCANDIVAVGALYECQRLGKRVPDDISIVGFDDLPLAQYVFPQLTSVRVPAAEMGAQAVELLLGLIAGNRARSRTLRTEIVVRGTSAPPPGA